MFAALITGYADLADWLWLIAAMLFAVAGLLAWRPARAPDAGPLWYGSAVGAFVPVGLALVAIGLLVL